MRNILVTLSFFFIFTGNLAISIPRIGILSKPLAPEGYDVKTNKKQVIEAKYARYIEGGGAKPIYLNYMLPIEELLKIMPKLNGLFFIGGATDLTEYNPQTNKTELTEYSRKGLEMIKYAIFMNENGIHFPIWGTCQGFELILLVLSGNNDILKAKCDCFKYNEILEFTEWAQNSRLYNFFSQDQIYGLGTVPMTYNSHDLYISVQDFYASEYLRENFNILSISMNQNKTVKFISTVEGKKYPIYATQFHPEKSAYDFNPNHPEIHTKLAILEMHAYAGFFVDEARKNNNSFDNLEEEAKYVIYNGEIKFDSRVGPLYLFD